jgi:hypothetical protein
VHSRSLLYNATQIDADNAQPRRTLTRRALHIPQHFRVIRFLVQRLRGGVPQLRAEVGQRRRDAQRMGHVVGGAHILGHQAQWETVGEGMVKLLCWAVAPRMHRVPVFHQPPAKINHYFRRF